jgi:anti-sigma-K factor RskA
MNHNEWLERAEIYAVGALDGDELTGFEAHLASGCSACADRLRETREALTLLPRALTPIDAPPEMRGRVLSRIPEPRITRRVLKARPGWLWWGFGAGALAAASLLLVLGWNIFATQRELQRLEARMTALRAELAQREEAVRLLADPQVRLVQLSGLPASPGATGRLLWNPVTRTGLFLTTGLPQTPTDRAYELWAIAGKEPVPAGVFTVDPRGRAVHRLPPLPEAKAYDKFAVTLEPAGGVAKPSGPMHLLGSL